MKDRFTATLLVIVAFVGGLLAMVVVARWQTGKPATPAAQLEAAAQAMPEAVQDRPDPVPDGSPAEGSAPVTDPPARKVMTTSGADSRGVASTTTTPRRDRTQPAPQATVERETAASGGTGRSNSPDPGRRTAAPQATPPRDQPSSPPSASGGAAGGSAGTKSSAGALPPTLSFTVESPPSETGRSSGRRPAPGSETTTPPPEDEAVVPTEDSQGPDLLEPPDTVNDPPDNRPRPDTPTDEPDTNEPDPEPEPEPPPPALVRVSATSAVFTVDDVVPVLVQIQSATDVGHVPFHLAFDPRVLRFDHGVKGDFLSTDGSPVVFNAVTSGSGDAVIVGLSRLGRVPGIDGAGLLCQLNFVAVGPGTTQLRFQRSAVKDSDNGPMLSAFESGSVSVAPNP